MRIKFDKKLLTTPFFYFWENQLKDQQEERENRVEKKEEEEWLAIAILEHQHVHAWSSKKDIVETIPLTLVKAPFRA